MTDRLSRSQLARAAARLKQARGSTLPGLVLLTDDERMHDPLGAIALLPHGSLVVLRAREPARRVALAESLARIARTHRLNWIVADDAPLAAALDADGAHFPEQRMSLAAHWRIRRPGWIITCAAHSLNSCARADAIGADAVFLAPVFATESHPGRTSIGPQRLRIIAHMLKIPIYALGGIDTLSARRLDGAHLAGLATIGALANS